MDDKTVDLLLAWMVSMEADLFGLMCQVPGLWLSESARRAQIIDDIKARQMTLHSASKTLRVDADRAEEDDDATR